MPSPDAAEDVGASYEEIGHAQSQQMDLGLRELLTFEANKDDNDEGVEEEREEREERNGGTALECHGFVDLVTFVGCQGDDAGKIVVVDVRFIG